jgi:hypothetical protein
MERLQQMLDEEEGITQKASAKEIKRVEDDQQKQIQQYQNARNKIVGSAMRFNESMAQIAMVGVSNQKGAAVKQRNIMLALAIVQGAASAVTAWQRGMESLPGPAGIVAAAASMGASLAATGAQIATLAAQTFARGTSFARGGLALVGEEGPEMVDMPRGARVFSAAQTRQFFNQPSTFTINISGNADQSTVASLQDALESFSDRFNQARRYGYIPETA